MPIEALRVDLTGITVKSFREIRESIASEVTGLFNGIDLSPSTPDGQLVDLFAYAYMEIAQGIQAIISNIDVNTAQGAFLDKLAAIAGVKRGLLDDSGLRQLIQQSAFNGLATVGSMRTYLRSTLGITGVSVIEDTSEHTVHVIVSDATIPADKIANAIFACKPAGIKTVGESSANTDEGYEIKFDYLTSGSLVLSVKIKRYNEESFPEDYQERIKNAIAAYVNDNFEPGKDIIIQRLYAPVYSSVSGVQSVSITATFNGRSSTDGIIPVSDGEMVTSSTEDISVEVLQ